MLSIADKIRLAWKVYEKGFAEGMEQETSIWQEIAAEDTLTSGHTKEFPMSFSSSEFREWTGERASGVMHTKVYSAGVKEYEVFEKVPVAAFKDDMWGDSIWLDKFRDMGAAAKRHPEIQVISAYQNGHNSNMLCVDEKPMFATDHPLNFFEPEAGVFSNYYVGTALTTGNFEAIYDEMMLRKTWMGIEMGLMPSILLIPPQLRRTAMKILKHSEVVEDGAAIPNDNFESAKIVISARLATQPTTWYVLAPLGRKRPVHFMWREKPVLKQETPTAQAENHIREVSYVGDARSGVYFNWPHLATKCTAEAR